MKIGARSDLFNCFGNDRYKKMKEMGFDYADYPVGDLMGNKTDAECEAMVLAERALADEAGIIIHQTHGPWRYPPHDETPELRAERKELMRRTIRLTAMIGCKNWIIHPLMPFGPDDNGFCDEAFYQINFEFFRDLLEYAKQLDVTICFENMPMKRLSISTTAKTLEFIRAINDDHFKLCLDTGHEMCYNEHRDMLALYGEKLCHTHFNDNLGVRGDEITFHDDLHLMPTDGIADWHGIMERIRKTGYNGILMSELSYATRPGKNGVEHKYNEMPLEVFMATAYEKIKKAISM